MSPNFRHLPGVINCCRRREKVLGFCGCSNKSHKSNFLLRTKILLVVTRGGKNSLIPLPDWLIVGQKFFALTSAARRVAFECDFDLSFAASRDKSPRLLSKGVKPIESGRWEEGKHKFFFNFDLHLRFHFRCTIAKHAGGQASRRQQLHQSPLGAHLSPIIGFLPATFSLSLFLSFDSLALLQVGDVHKRILKFMKQQRQRQQRAASESAATKRTFWID